METTEKIETKAGPTAPYVSFLTPMNVLKDMKQHGVPLRIDRSMFPNLAGGTVGQLLPAFKFLRLTNDSGEPTDAMKRLVAALESEAWKTELAKVVRAAYAPLFKIDLESASPAQFNELFRSIYPGTEDVSRKSQTFFLNAAREAEIKISPYIMKNKKPRTASNKKRAAKASNGKQNDGHGIYDNGYTPTVEKFPSEMLLGLFNPTEMEKAEQDAVWTLIKYFKTKGQ